MSANGVDQNIDVDDIQKDIDLWKGRLILFAVGLVAIYAMAFFTLKDFPKSLDAEKWGQFGDFVGGLMNPLVAFAAFYWLTQSVKLQKKELAATRETLGDTTEAQRELVKNGRVQIQLSALTALATTIGARVAAYDEQINKYNDRINESIIPTSTQDIMRQSRVKSLRAKIIQDRDELKATHDDYLEEMKEILERYRQAPQGNL